MLPGTAKAQLSYATNNGSITITGYSGPDSDVTIPNMIEGLPVTSIGAFAFSDCSALSSITVPGTVTNIGEYAFLTGPGGGIYGESASTNLTTLNVAPDNPNYSSVAGVLFNKSKTTLLQYPPGKAETSYTLFSTVTRIGQHAFDGCNRLANVTIPDSVTAIGDWAFFLCSSLTNVVLPDSVVTIGSQAFYGCASLTSFTIPAGVTNLGGYAFGLCTGLTSAYFEGDAPAAWNAFSGADRTTVYYLLGTSGWGSTFGERPTALWQPQVQTFQPSFGVRTNRFGFDITWASGRAVVVEACADLAHPTWSPLTTNVLTGGSFYFSDPQWTNYPARLYRLRWR